MPRVAIEHLGSVDSLQPGRESGQPDPNYLEVAEIAVDTPEQAYKVYEFLDEDGLTPLEISGSAKRQKVRLGHWLGRKRTELGTGRVPKGADLHVGMRKSDVDGIVGFTYVVFRPEGNPRSRT